MPRLLLLMFSSVTIMHVFAYNNGMARKPPLGWQTWCSAGVCGTDHCFDYQIKDTAKAMVDNGMHALGYEWILLDDCWHPSRDVDGRLVPHKEFFPDGMVPVIDYVHSLGLKFGLYTSVGDKTCHGGWSPGSYGYYDQDAQLFASWGVDYVKIDYCGDHDSAEGHANFSRALNQTGRPILLELCRGPYASQPGWGYAPAIAQVWRATGDHKDAFDSTLAQVKALSDHSVAGSYSKPYGWATGDMLMTGGEGCKLYDAHTPKHCPKQSDAEYRTEFTLYSVLSAPLMIGTDIRLMTSIMNELILNQDALRVNQDIDTLPGSLVKMCGQDAYVRKLSDGKVAIALPNLGTANSSMVACLPEVGITGRASIRDVWAVKDEGVFSGNYSAIVQPHDTLFLLVTPQ